MCASTPCCDEACSPRAQEGRGEYVGKVREMMARKQTRLLVDVADLRAFNVGLSRKCVPAWRQAALRSEAAAAHGAPGARQRTPCGGKAG